METIIKFKNGSQIKVLNENTQPERGRGAKVSLLPYDTIPSSHVCEIRERSVDMSKKIICNKCGKSFSMWDTQENFCFNSTLGYGTKYDGSKLELDLCCSCMEKLIDDCQISPIIDIEN